MKNYEAMNRDTIMSYFAIIGNATEISKSLIAIDEKEMATKMLGIADFCLTALDAETELPQVGIKAAFNSHEERLSFYNLRGRLGQDTKVVHKMIKEAMGAGVIGCEGVGRRKRYFQL